MIARKRWGVNEWCWALGLKTQSRFISISFCECNILMEDSGEISLHPHPHPLKKIDQLGREWHRRFGNIL